MSRSPTGRRWRALVAGALAVGCLSPAAPAVAGTGPIEVHPSHGQASVAAPSSGSFSYPADGSMVYVRSIVRSARAVTLHNLLLFDGRVSARTVSVPQSGLEGARIVGLIVDGRRIQATPNRLVGLGGGSYLVVLQEAVSGAQSGLVGLRVHVGTDTSDLPAGSELLVGLPTTVARHGSAARRPSSATASVLGFDQSVVTASAFAGGQGYVYPLAARGSIIGCPFAIGSTHSPFAWPDNLESDDAVDIFVPVGTPVLAVAAGTIGSNWGSLNSTDPRLQGLRLHLNTLTQRFYYTHMSRLDVHPGDVVQAGQQLGLSGSAAGVSHLHFAQDGGNPAATIGEASACPFFQQYNESW